MKTSIFKTILALIFLLITTSLLAQETIRGQVTDSTTTKPLIGANVYLVGTALGSATDLEGVYRIDRVPVGTYILRISYLGYRTKEVPVTVQVDRQVEINVALNIDFVEAEAVVVTGQALGQAAAINQQLTANTIVNVVSEEKIQELPDANAAESIGRLPGVSITRSGGEANKVVLRGLSDKYSTITLDGVRIAPTDANARGVDLSTISQGSLAGIELYKALTPEMDADAIAGSVNLVTKKAPSNRLLRLDSKGSFSDLNESYDQYDFVLRYGERFFNNFLGIQVSGNLEQRNRSRENFDIDYDFTNVQSGNDYKLTDFSVDFTDELRKRQGFSVLLDINTPDGGSIRANNIYNQTKRDFIENERNYPLEGDDLLYTARDREQEIRTFTSTITGANYLFGLESDWGLSYSSSKSEFPFDYEINFVEPPDVDSRMRAIPANLLKGPPESIIPLAYNNFQKASLFTAFYRTEDADDTERTAFLNLAREYTIGNSFSGKFKIGGKYRDKARDRSRSELFSPYYLEPFFISQLTNAGGTTVSKDFSGTRFADLTENPPTVVSMAYFLDPFGALSGFTERDVFGRFSLYPILSRDAIRQWWDLNQSGVQIGGNPEYKRNLEPDATFYDIDERVSSAYVMNTFNLGRTATMLAGLRMEHENNDYISRYTKGTIGGFPVPQGVILDTSAVHTETVWLPNFHLTLRPTGFMNVRMVAYKALARPDFNHRLTSVVTRAQSRFYSLNSLYVGNPGLKAAKAWNFEINNSLFSNALGLFSVSVFYRNISDMFQLIDGLRFVGQRSLDSLGIDLQVPFSQPDENAYSLTYAYNSSRPTKVWGLEIEHQASLRFLPGLLKNIVLSYNMSFIDSETFIPTSNDTVIQVPVPGLPIMVPKEVYRSFELKQKLQGQPDFFGNFAVGYDIGGFSGRVSVYHQGRFNQTFSPTGRQDVEVDAFTRLDLALKQKITKNIALLINVNNITDVEEGTSILNRRQDWDLLNEREKFGLTADLGVRVEF